MNVIHHYHFDGWCDQKTPDNLSSLVTLISEVEHSQRSIGGGPIVVHCRYVTEKYLKFLLASRGIKCLPDEKISQRLNGYCFLAVYAMITHDICLDS